MKICISQPMYLPWPGLFNQIKMADIFIHFDDVALPQGSSFCSRVQIRLNNEPKWLSVPIVRSSRKLIKDVLIDYTTPWVEQHLNKIHHSLSHAPHYEEARGLIEDCLKEKTTYLSTLNIKFIEKVSSYLGFRTQFLLSSNYESDQKSTERLLDLCKVFDAKEYITGLGALNYLAHERFETNKIGVKYMEYNIKSGKYTRKICHF